MPLLIRELHPIKELPSDYDALADEIEDIFRRYFYAPLAIAANITMVNARDRDKRWAPLLDAIRSGKLVYAQGRFVGKLDADLTKQLKDIGAVWDRKSGVFRLNRKDAPLEIVAAAAQGKVVIRADAAKLGGKLSQISPAEVAGKISVAPLLEKLLASTEDKINQTLGGLATPVKLTPDQRARIAAEYQFDLQRSIAGFAEDQIIKLRAQIEASAFNGLRYESLVKSIKRSHDVSVRKAKFLARQETSLLMTKFKEVRYASAGVDEYRWTCVAGSAHHPVRPSHKILDGKIFRWDDPPITTAPNEPVRRNNPGQDFNCRCFAKPIVRFKGTS